MDSHMIIDEMYIYSWSSTIPQGLKIKIDTVTQVTSVAGVTDIQAQTIQLDQQVNYKCSPWTVDNSKFTLPSDIKFMDISNMMNQMKTQPSGANQNNQAALCDKIEDPKVKASCIKTINQ